MHHSTAVKILICLMSMVLLFGSFSVTVAAEVDDLEPPLVEEATAVYFYHLESESKLVAKNTDLMLNAGSTAKIMAGLIACEHLQARLQDYIILTEEMFPNYGDNGRELDDLTVGDILTVEQLLYIALCGSYNNAYDALACYIAGSVEGFVDLMNSRAAELGATSTTFTDVSGIQDTSLTTVTDLSKIALAAYQNPLYIKITSAIKYRSPETEKMGVKTIDNYNALIGAGYNNSTKYYNAKCKGMNAGYTQRSGCCVVTVASNGTDSYLCVIMNAKKTETENFAFVLANRLINWAYNAFVYMEVISPESVVCTIPVTVAEMTNEIEVRAKESVFCYLPKGLEVGKDITYSVRLLYPSLEAPIHEGTMVGYVAILYQGSVIETLPIYTSGAAKRSGFMSGIERLQSLTQNRVFCAGAIFFAVTLTGWIVTEVVIIHKRKHKWDKYFSMKMNPNPTARNRKQQ